MSGKYTHKIPTQSHHLNVQVNLPLKTFHLYLFLEYTASWGRSKLFSPITSSSDYFCLVPSNSTVIQYITKLASSLSLTHPNQINLPFSSLLNNSPISALNFQSFNSKPHTHLSIFTSILYNFPHVPFSLAKSLCHVTQLT